MPAPPSACTFRPRVMTTATMRMVMTHNVLVVDDEPKLCDLLSSALSQNGIQVFTASNGLHALKVLEQEDIDLVISDWRMPGMDGPALLAEIKVRFPDLPVIVMTAYSTVKNAVQSMRNGAYDYIAKQFDIDELDITVAKALQFATSCATTRGCAPNSITMRSSTAWWVKARRFARCCMQSIRCVTATPLSC